MVSTGRPGNTAGSRARGWELRASRRRLHAAVPPGRAWEVVASAGPGRHWYVDAAPFVFRGAVDRAVLGAGRRWPVPDRDLLAAGDRAGFWEVREAGPRANGHRLVLEAAVRAPGTVTLVLEVLPDASGRSGCELSLEIRFEPRGLLGAAYLLADLPAREAVTELVALRVASDLS